MSSRGWEHVKEADIAAKVSRGSVRATTPGQAPTSCLLAPEPSKYRNVKTVVGTQTFDSKREARYWQSLLAAEAVGEINSLHRQVVFALCAPDRTDQDMQHVPTIVIVANYVADFTFYDRAGKRHVVDAKGKRTQMYLLKRKWLELQDGIVIEEV